jgi:hypothetical protein
MSPTCPRRALEINGLAGYRFASRCADGGRDLLYVLFSGDRAYFIEGCARASTWAVDRRLFEAAMRSVVVVDPREGTTVSASSGAQRAA